MAAHVLAIDQGTTSSRAIVFERDYRPVAIAQQEFPQHFPASGWVEHDPEDIWRSVLGTVREAMGKAALSAADIAAIGITNQRETTVIWDRKTGAPIHNAIVWQDRRTAQRCDALKKEGHERSVRHKTGLLLDPYFSATKIAWILDTVPGARQRAKNGELAFGTIDSFLLWRLSGGAVHATDETNASRTALYNIFEHRWDDDLLDLFDVPRNILPMVKDSDSDFGLCASEHFGGPIAICGMAGDQQAAAIGQACFRPGMIKSTYGTGCFALLNTGDRAVLSDNRLLSTIAYRIEGRTTYALEGSIFIAGAAVQWLRDGLGIIENATDTARMAREGDPGQDVYLVPAFTGLGAPYWDAHARGAMFGLTRATGPKEFARAALEAVCYQTRDLVQAMRRDWPQGEHVQTALRVDGGMVANDWVMQCLADILNATVDRPRVLETTALGAAYLAGKRAGVYPPMEAFAAAVRFDKRFSPKMDDTVRERKYQGWQDAVRRTLSGISG